MANADSTTIARPEIEPAITALLKTPLGLGMDLFQLLDACEFHADALIENDDNTERMALCGRLFVGLEALKTVLKEPLPAHLIKRLTVGIAEEDNYRSPLTTDSETLREYCVALTLLLLQRQQPIQQEEHITEMLFEWINVLAEDLKTPRFVRTSTGLAMISGGENLEIH
jgi:hypothetical protein